MYSQKTYICDLLYNLISISDGIVDRVMNSLVLKRRILIDQRSSNNLVKRLSVLGLQVINKEQLFCT